MRNHKLGALPSGMCVRSIADDALELRLDKPVGQGTMRVRFASPHVAVATVDFTCEACPSIPFEDKVFSGFWEPGTIFTVNHCLDGRCEVSLTGKGYAIVKPGDFCVSRSDTAPEEYRYPLGRYRGIEVIAHSGCVEDSQFQILQDSGFDLEGSVRKAGFAAIYAGNAELNGIMERLGAAEGQPGLPMRASDCFSLYVS